MDYYVAAPVTPFHTAAGSFFNTFTAFQDISPAPKPLLPAEAISRPGQRFEIEAWGEYSCATGVTLILGAFFGVVAQSWQTAAYTTGTTPTLWPWHLKFQGMVLTTGSSGTIIGQGIADIGDSLTTTAAARNLPAVAASRTVTVDTTTAKYLGVGAAWSASAAGNTIKTNLMTALLLN